MIPNIKITINKDKVGTSPLKSLAQNADIFVIATSSAKHAATTFIQKNRSKEDKVTLEKIQKQLNEDEELRKVHISDNTESNRRFVFNKVFDKLLQGLVDESLGFYKKLTEPKRNEYVKRVLFDNYSEEV